VPGPRPLVGAVGLAAVGAAIALSVAMRLHVGGNGRITAAGRDYESAGRCPANLRGRFVVYRGEVHGIPAGDTLRRAAAIGTATPAVLYLWHGRTCARTYALVGGP